jgi:hypothetical protein
LVTVFSYQREEPRSNKAAHLAPAHQHGPPTLCSHVDPEPRLFFSLASPPQDVASSRNRAFPLKHTIANSAETNKTRNHHLWNLVVIRYATSQRGRKSRTTYRVQNKRDITCHEQTSMVQSCGADICVQASSKAFMGSSGSISWKRGRSDGRHSLLKPIVLVLDSVFTTS